MKKLIAILLAAVMVVSMAAMLAGCTPAAPENDDPVVEDPAAALKLGFIFLGDENEAYTGNFYNSVKFVAEKYNLSDDQIVIKWSVPEDNSAFEAACDLADQGCNLVFANSFSYEDYMVQAANEYPEVEFCHATGIQAKLIKLDNYHNAFSSIYEGRYLAGIVAGMKLNEMIENGDIKAEEAKMGYVGAFPYAEVISGYTSFYLGAKSVCPSVTMDVVYTNSWSSADLEKNAAESLISSGCVLISQHADTTGAPIACENAGIPCVGYNVSMIAAAPNSALVSSSICWDNYMDYIVSCLLDGSAIDTDWLGSLAEGSVVLTELNSAAIAAGTEEAVEAAKTMLINGELHVFDTATFTVGGNTVDTALADIDGDYVGETEAVWDGYFHESELDLRSAPYFELKIDGITEK